MAELKEMMARDLAPRNANEAKNQEQDTWDTEQHRHITALVRFRRDLKLHLG